MLIRNSTFLPSPRRVKFTLVEGREYDEKQNEFGDKFVSNGTTVGHIIYDKSISLCEEIDKKKGVPLDSGWLNRYMATSFHYNGSSINRAQLERHIERHVKKKKNPSKLWKPDEADWMEFFMPLLTIYLTKDANKLVNEGLAEYHKFAKDCPAFGDRFIIPDEILGEWQIYSNKNYPIEVVNFVTLPTGIQLDTKFMNKRLPYLLERLQEKRSGNIILLENFGIVSSKNNLNRTGATDRIWNAYKLMTHINEFI